VPTALITLLASTPEEVELGGDDRTISDLARALLRLLVAAKDEGTNEQSDAEPDPVGK
jgi:hypothetical protein